MKTQGQLIESARQKAVEALKGHAEEMAARMCERRKIQNLAMSNVPDWKTIKDNCSQSISIPVDSQFYSEELNRFNKLIVEEDLDRLVARYPVHKSCAHTTIAQSSQMP